MSNGGKNFWDSLSVDEAQFVESVMGELADEPWARSLLLDINGNGGLTRVNKAKFFELRFGYALHQVGIIPRYEVDGEAQSTLDFGLASSGKDWLVELMRLEETEAVRRATYLKVDEDGTEWSSRTLSTNAKAPTESEEGETLKAVQRICQKCERDGRAHKFSVPHSTYHVILVDFRTFLHGGDVYDRIHVGLGGAAVREAACRRYWNGNLISGVFSPHTNVRGAAEVRNRVHFLGFVCEKSYEPCAFGRATQFIFNPNLFSSADDAYAAIASWPLQPAQILNGGV